MLLGIDLGTSSLKVLVFDPDTCRCVAQQRVPLTVHTPSPDRAEVDAEAVWRLLVDALAALEERKPALLSSVRAVGLSTIFPALVPMGKNGQALYPVILYSDHRSREQVRTLQQSFEPQGLEALTGNRLTPGTTTLPSILWLRDNEPEVYANTATFAQLSTFLVHRLTGNLVVDPSHTSLSGMVNAGNEDHWSEQILATVGLEPERLPTIISSCRVGGVTTEQAAKSTGLPVGIPVVAGCGDAPLAAFGGGVTHPGQVFCSAGTTDCLMFSGNHSAANPTFCNVRCPTPGLWVSIGTMSTAGASVKWLCEEFLHCTADEMTAWAAETEPGSRGLTYLPYLQGERTPWWDPAAKGAFVGLTLNTGHREACRAVLEGIACGWRQIISLLEDEYAFRPGEIISVGGGSTNALWNQIKATLLDRPVHALDFTEITSVGAAMLAGIGAGIYRDAAAAVAATEPLRNTSVYEPLPEWREAMEETYARYLALYPTLKPLFRA